MRKFNDPNVVTYYITENVGPLTYIVMELATKTLADIIKNSKSQEALPLKKWATDMTKGLLALHNHKIVHRDLKPSNVLIFDRNVAKLADFGISRELKSCTRGLQTDARRGTLMWMPPEALQSADVTFQLLPSFDIFSLALTIHFTMTRGKHLFDSTEKGGTDIHVSSNIIENRRNWKSTAHNQWTALKNLLEAMISIDPKKRPGPAILLEHPFFWNDKKGLDFVYAVHNDFKNSKGLDCSGKLNGLHTSFCQKTGLSSDWGLRLCPNVQSFLNHMDETREQKSLYDLSRKKYKQTSLVKLIEFIRDNDQHRAGWSGYKNGLLQRENVFGAKGCNYVQYFFGRFPELTTILYTFFQEPKYHGSQLPQYYRFNKNACFPQL